MSAVKRIPSHFTKAANQPASAYAPKATTLPSAGIASLHLSAASAAPVKATGTPVWARPVVEARGRYSGPPGLDGSLHGGACNGLFRVESEIWRK